MGWQCTNCKDQQWKESDEFEFNYMGLSIKVMRPGGKCINCARNDFIQRFGKYSPCFTHAGKKITAIDWNKFQQYCENSGMNDICELFLNLGIFSLNPEGNWQIVADKSFNLNPCFSSSIVFFTDVIQVANYAAFKLKDAERNWHLQRIGKVFTKSQLKEMGLL